MIRELTQFTESLDDDFKNLGVKPKFGLHILMKIVKKNDTYLVDNNSLQYEIYSKKLTIESDLLKKCKFLSLNAWMIDTNKCFDAPAKAIHSCSPYCVGFKREHLDGGEKYKNNRQEKKKQIDERFENYFVKALALFPTEEEKAKYQVFKEIFTAKEKDLYFSNILLQIENDFANRRNSLDNEIKALNEKQKQTSDKNEKVNIKNKLEELSLNSENFKELSESDYIIFYLDEPLEKYKEIHKRYLADKLFNKDDYNTLPDNEGMIYGVSNFFNSVDSGGNKDFLKHQTATFNITSRISNIEAKNLFEFEDILKRGILPKPLPIFIFKDELQKEVIGIFKESGFKLTYKEIVEKLWNKYRTDFGNYYLLFYQNTKDGIVFRDFDYVSKFEYELKDTNGSAWEIEDLFNINFEFKIHNIFEFQSHILQIIFNNHLIVKTKDGAWIYKYFDEIDKEYCKSAANYLLILKYRQAFYDFIYKSKRQIINKTMFDDMMKTSILEDIRLDEIKNNNHNEYLNIRKKLSIWFSLYDNFNINTKKGATMASKLKDYQKFVDDLAENKADIDKATSEHFAFASGQVIDYILKKSKSSDQSYQRLEPYLQQSKCEELKKAISNDFARYKHENFSRRFENVASFVLTYNTDDNIKTFLPEILAGVFSNNQLFGHKENKELINNNQETI